MKIVIIGSGLAGCIAYKYFSDRAEKVIMISDSKTLSPAKDILYRTKNEELALLLNINSEKVKIRKNYLYNKKLFKESNIMLDNLYSIKLSNSVSERSINNSHLSEFRFLNDLSGVKIENKILDSKVIEINKNIVKYVKNCVKNNEIHEIGFDVCISTIPLVHMFKILDTEIEDNQVFKCEKIITTKINCSLSSEVNQTIYVPELKYQTYRITFQKGLFIIESLEKLSPLEIFELTGYFGISGKFLETASKREYVREVGEINDLNSVFRKSIILNLTKKYNIYSFGRYAIWNKKVKTEDMLIDIKKIHKMVEIDNMEANEYDKE